MCLTIFLTGCQTTATAPVERQLPPGSSVVLAPAAAPVIRPGADARVAWKREEAARKENEARLIKSRQIYDGVRQTYRGGE